MWCELTDKLFSSNFDLDYFHNYGLKYSPSRFLFYSCLLTEANFLYMFGLSMPKIKTLTLQAARRKRKSTLDVGFPK